jgi:hypothetical protein
MGAWVHVCVVESFASMQQCCRPTNWVVILVSNTFVDIDKTFTTNF